MAREPGSVDGVLSFLDVLLGRTATIVEPGDALGGSDARITVEICEPARTASLHGPAESYTCSRRHGDSGAQALTSMAIPACRR